MSLVRSYDTETAPRGMLRHVRQLPGYPGLLWQYRFTIHNFFRRDLMDRFHGSYLGAWWMLVQPVFLFCVYYAVFGVLFGDRWSEHGPDPTLAIYLFSGVIVFHSMLESLGRCVTIVTANGNLVKKVAFPSEALVIPASLMSLVMWAVGAVVCFGLGTAFGILHPGLMLLTLPLVLALQFVFTVGFGLFLANANVFIRDVGQLWRILSMAWFFLTPIFWEPERLTRLQAHGLGWIEALARYGNPAFPLVMCHRIAIGGTDPQLGEFWPQFGVLAAWSVFFLVLGYTSFVASKHKYADVV